MIGAKPPPPPDGYTSWLEYAVSTMDSRSPELAASFNDQEEGDAKSRASMREAVWAEFNALRRQAGLPAVKPRF